MLEDIREALRHVYRNSGLREVRLERVFRNSKAEWADLQKKADDAGPAEMNDAIAVIVPPDPLLVTGSKGDEAMIKATISQIRQLHGANIEIIVLTAGPVGDENVKLLGAEPACVLEDQHSLEKAYEALEKLKPGYVYTLGADVIDGHSDPNFSLRIVAVTDLAARMGAKAKILGFSYSKAAYDGMRDVFLSVHDDMEYCLRDPMSFERFRKIQPHNAKLVADAAFLLPPKAKFQGASGAAKWVAAQKENELKIIGLNFHSLLIPLKRRKDMDLYIQSLADILISILRKYPVRFVLLAHDFRDKASDRHCHEPLFDLIDAAMPDHALDVSKNLPAEELKALVGELDGVISGRMHLSIASLGMGVPVFAFSYNDKVEGLLKHFKLEPDFIADAEEILSEPKEVERLMVDFIEALDDLTEKVSSRVGEVRKWSLLNFQKHPH